MKTKTKGKKFNLYTRVINCGDGSACTKIHASEAAAIKEDDKHNEEGDGWAESSVGSIKLVLRGTKLFLVTFNGHELELKESK